MWCIMINMLCERSNKNTMITHANPTAATKSWDNFSRGEGRAGWRTGAIRGGTKQASSKLNRYTALCCVVFWSTPPKGNKECETLRHRSFIRLSHLCVFFSDFMTSRVLTLVLNSKVIDMFEIRLRYERDEGAWCMWNQLIQWGYHKLWFML